MDEAVCCGKTWSGMSEVVMDDECGNDGDELSHAKSGESEED